MEESLLNLGVLSGLKCGFHGVNLLCMLGHTAKGHKCGRGKKRRAEDGDVNRNNKERKHLNKKEGEILEI